MTPHDKAGKTYWDANWSNTDLPKLLDINDKSLDNHFNLELHKYFQKLLGHKKNLTILEIGCANSVWPVYFHQHFGADVSGLDYSEIGCEKSQALLDHYHVPGKIHCANLFSAPQELLGQFDIVVSFGVVEHFENTAECLKACAAFLKPGGMLFTLIPNIPSIIGLIQKYVDRSIYDIHVPLTKKMFRDAHQDAGLTNIDCDYFMSISLSIVNSGIFSTHPFNKYLRRMLSIPSKICWFLERYGLKIPKNRFTSPYITATAKS